VNLVELLKRNEGKTLEFKRDLSSPDGILRCLVAFANTAGGIVVIGVEDGSKNVRGVPGAPASEEKLANLVSDSIRPRLIPDIEVAPWRKRNVLAVQVYPSNTRPHYLKRLGPEDGVFIRAGSTNRKAEAPQIEELKRLNWRSAFDEQAIPDLKSEAIDFRDASELFAPYRQLTAQAWRTFRITAEHQGRQVPTVGGCFFSARTASPGFRMPGSRQAASPERIERASSIRRRSARSCLAPRKRPWHSHTFQALTSH
jgi:predicted HTH transcriptional regulator